MSDDDKKVPGPGDPLDLDLEAALDQWESDFDGGDAVRSEAAPLPQTGAMAPPAPPPPPVPSAHRPKQPLYRPPDPADFTNRDATRRGSADLDDFSIDFDDDEDATRIGEIPADLMASLRQGLDGADTPTRPPPAASEAPAVDASAGDADLELDDLFDGWEEGENETRHITPIPSVPSRPPAPMPAPAPAAMAPRAPIRGDEPTAQLSVEQAEAAPLLEDEDFADFDDLFQKPEPQPEPQAVHDAATPPHGTPTDELEDPSEDEEDGPPAPMPPTPRAIGGRQSLAGLRPRSHAAGEAPAPHAVPAPAPAATKGEVFTQRRTEPPPAAKRAATSHADPVPPSVEAPAATRDAKAELGVDDDMDAFLAGGDDDEPSFELGGDDEAALTVGADDDEPSFEPGGDDDDLEGDDDMLDVGDDEPAAGADRGASAAARTVRNRKPRTEHFPLVGRGADALVARRTLLSQLAEGRQGAAAARLHVAAAELAARAGDGDGALELYQDAYAADPRNAVALRALRCAALARKDYAAAAELLAAEAQLATNKHEKAFSLTLLAELFLTQLADPEGALTQARRASMAQKESPVARLIAAEAALALDRRPEAMTELAKLAEVWEHPGAKATLYATVARDTERRLGPARAAEAYAAAQAALTSSTLDGSEFDRMQLDVGLGVHRSARASQDAAGLASSLPALANTARSAPLAEGLVRAGALAAFHVSDDRARALTLLEGSQSALGLRTRADIAADAGDLHALRDALGGWADAAGGSERAEALLRLAELEAERGDIDAAEEALAAAARADDTLGLLPVVRELLARRSGDASRLAQAVESGTSGGHLASAATLARDLGAAEQERTLLTHAAVAGEAPTAVAALMMDAAAGFADLDTVDQVLGGVIDRASADSRLGPLLARVSLALARGAEEQARTWLEEASERAPGDARVLRPLGRLAPEDMPLKEAGRWLEEAATTDGERSAFCAVRAARVVAQTGGDPTGPLRRALDADPDYLPALWALLARSLMRGDVESSAALHLEAAEHALDPREVALALTRAALLRSGDDPADAAALIARARTTRPGDGLLDELALRLSDPKDSATRAQILEARLLHAPPEEKRDARLNLAHALEGASGWGRAAELYRAVLAQDPGDAIAVAAVDRAELAAGEGARVAGRLFDAVRAAETDDERVRALAIMADHDLYERHDASSAMLSLESILEVAPGHLPSLRSLERHYMDGARNDDLRRVEELLAQHVDAELRPNHGEAQAPEGEAQAAEGAAQAAEGAAQATDDAAAHARLAARLRLASEDATADAADEWLVRVGDAALGDGWMRRERLAIARGGSDHAEATRVLMAMAARATTALQRTALVLRAAEAQARATGPADAAALLMDADGQAHPNLLEQRASYRAAAEDAEGAAADLLAAAEAALDDNHRTSLLYRAGLLFEEPLASPDRALEAYTKASELHVGYRDLFDRSRRLLEAANDTAGLSRLLDRRLAHGGETPVLVELYLARAELAEGLGDSEGAREALRSALALAPDHADALKRLGHLCLEASDWPHAAEALIRLARLRQDREELRFIFFTLGDIYDRHTPDPKRARAAFERVLKLAPDDLEAMHRLATIHRGSGNLPDAVEVLTRLIKRELDPDESRRHRLVLASVFEEMGDLRRAESVLEQTRRNAPTEIEVLSAQADFYQRQGAASALSMHLNRAIDDFRRAIDEDPSDAHAWPGLAHVLKSRGREDAARCVASAATALGITDVMMSPLVDARGAIPGAGQAAAHPDLDSVLSPVRLTGALRQVFKAAGPAFDKVLPLDTRALGASKASGREPLRAEVQRVGAMFGVSDVQLLISERLPTACLPVSGSPITLVIGSQLAQHTTPEGRIFLFARALKIANDHLALAVRTSPGELALLLGGLLRGYDPDYTPAAELDSAKLDDMARRVHKAIGRRGRDDLMPLALEMNGTQGYDPLRVGTAAAELGDRVALVATGDTPAAFRALLSLSGMHLHDSDGVQARLAALRQSEEAFALLSFAISDAYFEARHRVGADRR